MAIAWKSKILLAKIEGPYGVDAGPTGAANAILAKDVRLQPMEGNDVSRELELPTMGGQPTVPTELHAKMTFMVEMVPSGAAGIAPAWGPLLRACAVSETIVADTSVTYAPISEGHESATFHFWIGNTRYALIGSRGNFTLRVDAQGIPYLEFEFTGLFTQPSEVARVTPDLSAFQVPDIATSAATSLDLDGVSFVTRSFSFASGNVVEGRFLIGAEYVFITDKAEQIECKVEAVPLTTFNPYALAAAQTPVEIVLTHGTAVGRIITFTVDAAQMQRPAGLENAQGITEWPLRLVPKPVTVDDQWSLALT